MGRHRKEEAATPPNLLAVADMLVGTAKTYGRRVRELDITPDGEFGAAVGDTEKADLNTLVAAWIAAGEHIDAI